MNKQRRKRVENLIEELEALKAQCIEIAEEERECYDNMEEHGLGESERAQIIDENASDLEDL